MAKDESLNINTPEGNLVWVKINGNEDEFKGVKTGKYSASLEQIPEEDAKKFEEVLLDYWNSTDTAKECLDEYGENDRPNLGIKLGKGKKADKGWNLKATTNTTYVRDGNVIDKVVPIYDGQNNRLDDSTQIWNGSKGMLNLYVRPYRMSSSNYGLSLKLSAVGVTELVSGGGSADKSPFGVIEGTKPYGANKNTEDIPF